MIEPRSAVTPHLLVAVTLMSGNASATALRSPQTIALHAANDDVTEFFTTAPQHSSAGALVDRLRRDAIDELNRYLAFEPGWDGYDGLPFSPKAVATAASIVERLCERLAFAGSHPTEITPGPISDGRIDIEVVVEGRRVVLTIDPDEDLISVAHQELHGKDEGLAQSDEQGVDGWLDWVSGTLRMPSLLREASVHSRR